MRLKTRVLIIIAISLLGLVVMGLLGLYGMRQSMLNERRLQIIQLLDFAESQVSYYYSLEINGKLSHEEAQSKAKAAIGAQRKGDVYFFVRDWDDVMLVHPVAARINMADDGGKMPDGKSVVDVYKSALKESKLGRAIYWSSAPRPNKHDKIQNYPKLSGVTEFKPWGWIIGIGFFVDDINMRFWKHSITFLITGAVLLLCLTILILRMRWSIIKQVGGEPRDATEFMKQIANGNLNIEITLDANDSNSLMASIKLMQMKLKNITTTIQDNSSLLEKQVQNFDEAAKAYVTTKDEDGLANLLKTTKQIEKTANILEKSVSRFKK
ncbi:Cache domain-containing protein [Formivibrio citricus]|uniref:Cache domain-containing protein n=1 Tax=Formivibrio citricus TaxID=83765 RepID=A0A1I5E041_9NEIS|nr:cache domain-containing protein [Formivibrio citricus]SFO04865.1 Cache domain-containing protein [Formivibrio citricus]